MDGASIPPRDDEVDIELPDDPRVPRPEDADPTRSKELGGAAPAVGPGPASSTDPPEEGDEG